MFFFFAYLLAKFVSDYNCGIIIWELKRKGINSKNNSSKL